MAHPPVAVLFHLPVPQVCGCTDDGLACSILRVSLREAVVELACDTEEGASCS